MNYKNVLDSTRVKVPFGIAQTGKAFRNEVVARQFVFRMREFEQMEMQYFVEPGTDEQAYEEWLEKRLNWHKSMGIRAKTFVLLHIHLINWLIMLVLRPMCNINFP